MCFVVRIDYSSFYSSLHKILCGIQALTCKEDSVPTFIEGLDLGMIESGDENRRLTAVLRCEARPPGCVSVPQQT